MDAPSVPTFPIHAFAAEDRDAVYRAILSRRDVRGQFLPEPIADDILSRLLIAAHYAPSVGYMQPWSFVLVRDANVKRRVHDLFLKANAEAAAMFPQDRGDLYRSLKLEGIREAPINICITCDRDRAGDVVLGRTHNPTMDIYSTVCAVQNLWLAARAEGIGVGWVSILDHEALRETLGIPPSIVPIAYLCLGHVSQFRDTPDLESAGWRARLPLAELIHFDHWNERSNSSALLDRIRETQAAVDSGEFLKAP